MNGKQLEKIGMAIFPTPNWKKRLADILDVDKQTVYRWVNGGYPKDAEYHKDILKFAKKQREKLDSAIYSLEGYKK